MKQFKKLSIALLGMLCIAGTGSISAMVRGLGQRSVGRKLVPMGARGIFDHEGKIYALASERSNPDTNYYLTDSLHFGFPVHLVDDSLERYLMDPNDSEKKIYVPVVRMRVKGDQIVSEKVDPIALVGVQKADKGDNPDYRGLQLGISKNYDAPSMDLIKKAIKGDQRTFWDKLWNKNQDKVTASLVRPDLPASLQQQRRLKPIKELFVDDQERKNQARLRRVKLEESWKKDPFAMETEK